MYWYRVSVCSGIHDIGYTTMTLYHVTLNCDRVTAQTTSLDMAREWLNQIDLECELEEYMVAIEVLDFEEPCQPLVDIDDILSI